MSAQALFNFVIAWSLMLGPLMFADRKAANVQRKWPLFIGTLVGPACVHVWNNTVFVGWWRLGC